MDHVHPDANALAAMLSDRCLLCGAEGPHECRYSILPLPVLGEPVGPSLHSGRCSLHRPCGYCRAPRGEACTASPLAGPVVEMDAPLPLTEAGRAAGWGSM